MNKKGFTMIELMVVIAIIGILSSVAVPQFRRFQAKAKQANAKAELTGIYMAEQSFFTEHTTYHTDLVDMGYLPDGYTVGACPTGDGAPPTTVGVTRYYLSGFSAAGPAWPASITQNCAGIMSFGATVLDVAGAALAFTTGPNVNGAGNQFTAEAVGNVGGGSNDVWTIDHNRALLNSTQGI